MPGTKGCFEGSALVDSGAWYTVIDGELAESVGVKYAELTVALTSFSGHKVACREAILSSVTLEGKSAPSELVAVCSIPKSVRELLRKHGVDDRLVVGVHTLERLGFAVDVAARKLVKSPGILMI